MIDTDVLNWRGKGVKSLVDDLYEEESRRLIQKPSIPPRLLRKVA